MAKMALNGYEIGIQRKIKPADHIQSMADKIQDTVVTKHPLNADSSSGENRCENTLKQPLNKLFEKGYKTQDNIQQIGDKIKETIMSNHPTAINFANGNVPPPPPIPNTPVPSINAQSTPIGYNSIKKPTNIEPKNLNTSFVMDTSGTGKSLNNSRCSSTEDLSLKNKTDNYYSNTLRKKEAFEKSAFLNGMNSSNNDMFKTELKLDNNYSNTLNKKKIFETKDTQNSINTMENPNKCHEKSHSSLSEINTSNKTNLYEKSCENGKPRQNQENIVTPGSSKKLHDNTLYIYKTSDSDANSSESKNNTQNLDHDIEHQLNASNSDRNQENTETETIVRRREKRNPKNDDGRRDSHIVARPLSTMTSTDVADGLYPVCHKCDKAITRGPFITALGRIWCPEHFVCVNATCRRHLQDIGFVEENGQLYCEYCFEQYIAPACDKCHAKIKGDCLNAIGKHFHPECFNCVYCGKLFGNNPFFLEDGLPYCEADWNELFTTKCFACGFPVEAGDRWVEALNNNYHSQCFNCTVCKKNLEGQSFFAKGGRPFCKTHAR